MANIFEDMNEVSQSLVPQSDQRASGLTISSPMQAALEAKEYAAIQGKIFMAKQFPRNMREVQKEIDTECSRTALASKAVYTYARAGNNIQGPSIRLAETLARCFGNIESSTEVISQSDEASLVKVSSWDYESNRQASRTFVVKHERWKNVYDKVTNKKEKVREILTDSRDILEMINNIAARNRRACILELIPGDYVDRAVAKCSDTIKSNIKITPEYLSALVESFAQFGVTQAMIEARIQRKIEAITVDQVVNLRTVYTSLKDGMGTSEDFFDTSIQDDQNVSQSIKAPKKAARKLEDKSQSGAEKKAELPAKAAAAESAPVKTAEESYQEPPENEYAGGPEDYGDDDLEDF